MNALKLLTNHKTSVDFSAEWLINWLITAARGVMDQYKQSNKHSAGRMAELLVLFSKYINLGQLLVMEYFWIYVLVAWRIWTRLPSLDNIALASSHMWGVVL